MIEDAESKYPLILMLLLLAGTANAADTFGCGQRGNDLANTLWEKRRELLMSKYRLDDAVTTSAKPKLSDAWFFDRVTLGVSYGNFYDWEAGSIAEPYMFKSDKRSWSGEIKYTIPFNLFRHKGPSSTALDKLREYTAEQERASFFDLIYDLRIALAERDAASNHERTTWELKAAKHDARIRNLTDERGYAMECIR